VKLFVSADRELAVKIAPKSLKTMLRETQRAGRRETGGILIGRYTETQDQAIVEEATTAPSDSKREPAAFFRGVAGLTALLKRRWRRGHYYVGDWHFHPFTSAEPSPRDLAQMRAFSSDPRYQCARPILVVIGGDPRGDWSVEVRVISGACIALAPVAPEASARS
jgi:proteasome lid subunit RPN8/RPN11